MTDATSTVIAVNALNTSLTGVGVVLFGMHTGLDYPTLLAGTIGGATALSYLQPSSMLKRSFEVISASLLAGYASPPLVDFCEGLMHKVGVLSPDIDEVKGLQLGLAFIIGYTAHGLILPGIRKIGDALIRRHSSD